MFFKNKQSGFTLVEVIASIIIITIILVSFFSFFINTAKTTKTSNEILDATYYAQKEMEYIYNLSTTSNVITGYAPPLVEGLETIYTKNENGFFYRLTTKPYNDKLTIFTIEIYNEVEGGRVLKAQMENILEWGTKYDETQ